MRQNYNIEVNFFFNRTEDLLSAVYPIVASRSFRGATSIDTCRLMNKSKSTSATTGVASSHLA
jgi:hypothetical protein